MTNTNKLEKIIITNLDTMIKQFLLPTLLLFFLHHPTPVQSRLPTERPITILNESSRRISIHWIHPETNELVLQSTPDILNAASQTLNSYVGHTFQVTELPAKKTGVCAGENEECRVNYFTVNENDDQIVFVKQGLEVEHSDSKAVADKSAVQLLEECKSEANKKILAASPTSVDDASGSGANLGPEESEQILEELTTCVQKGIAKEIEKANEEITFQSEVRKGMAGLLENYTCADETLNSTEAKSTVIWDGRKVGIIVDRPASKIHTIEKFLTEAECQAVEERAKPLLHDATVADGSGGSHLSESRKAKQAGIKVDWDKEQEGDLIARLSRRVYDYVNHVLPFEIKENGQEDLMSIQYFGRGPDDDKPDRYMPHCDGDCNGLDFKPGNRMATIVMYCEVPKVGGATNFRNSGVHIKPKKYAATFFSYIDPVSMKMDDGFTEHSGCPVIEGEKKIVTQWVRLGVDNENPWDSFNTLGVKYSDADEQ
mmetsp:Transcript_3274/g.6831  ORF Transcript_3274/g.6831 Transcript_3274/m.6831 type:complete len:486 (-) Transcript_3274:225-1682(-)